MRTSPPDNASALSPEAQSLLMVVSEAPQGLPTSWIWERGGFSGLYGNGYRECLYAGFLSKPMERLYLTDAGVEKMGLVGYTANDPTTWSEPETEKVFLRGYCHALAIALHRRFGCKMILVSSEGGLPLHVLVQDAEGALFDFDGPTTRERIVADIGVARAVFSNIPDEAAVRRLCGGHNRLREFTEHDVTMAMKYVDGRPNKYAEGIVFVGERSEPQSSCR